MARNMADKFLLAILGTLNEAQARWYVAREAIALGRGGIKAMQELTRLSKPTILRGIRELKTEDLPPPDRVRKSGGGRKRLEQSDPSLSEALRQVMEVNTAGDPMSLLRWTNKSTTTIAKELARQGHSLSHETVRKRLMELGYSLQANRKNKDGLSPPERDAQFRYINQQVRRFLARGEPVISVDTKKKERVGNFKNAGKTWRPQGQPEEVESHDYPHLGKGTAIPHGTLVTVHRLDTDEMGKQLARMRRKVWRHTAGLCRVEGRGERTDHSAAPDRHRRVSADSSTRC